MRSPWGQGIVVDKAISYVSEKTGTKIGLERLFITFNGNLYLERLYVEDLNADTLLYTEDLELGFGLWKFIRTNEIHLSKLDWQGLKASVSREEGEKDFNYQFLIDAFVSEPVETPDSVEKSEGSPPKISLRPILFRDFDLRFSDAEAGMEAILKFEELKIDIPYLDLEEFEFDIKELALKGSQIAYTQSKPFEEPEDENSSEIIPLLLSLQKLSLDRVKINYDNQVDSQKAVLNLNHFSLSLPELDLKAQKVMLKSLDLNDSEILFYDFSESDAQAKVDNSPSEAFTWPDWIVEIGYISLGNNQLIFRTKDQDPKLGFFNPESIQLEGLNLELNNVALKEDGAKLSLNTFEFQEASGFELKKFMATLGIDDKVLEIGGLELQTNRSELLSDLKINYASLAQFIEMPERAKIDFRLRSLKADVRDAYFFQPELAQDDIIKSISQYPILARAKIEGTTSSMRIPDLLINWGTSRFVAQGALGQVLDMDRLSFDFPRLELSSDEVTLRRFVDENLIADYQLPEEFKITANAKGKLNDLSAAVQFHSDMGKVDLKATYKDLGVMAFVADLKVDQLQLGNILNDPGLDTLTFSLHAEGSGSSLDALNASLSSDFERLIIYGNDYSGLDLSGELDDGVGKVLVGLDSENLEFDLITKLELDSANYKVDLNLDLKGADFYALGFSPQGFRGRLKFNASFDGNLESFDLSTIMEDAIVIYDQRNYPLGSFDIKAAVRPDSTSLEIKSLLLNGRMSANTSPEGLVDALTAYLRTYIDTQDSLDNLPQDIKMKLNLSINQAPVLNQVFLPGLEKLDTARLEVDFDMQAAKLMGKLDFPYMKYAGIEVDSLGIRINADEEDLNLAFGFLKLDSGPFAMDRTYFTGELQDSRLFFDFNAFDGDERMVHVASDIGLIGDTLSIHISPEDLLLNKREWGIPEQNEVLIAKNYLKFKDLRFFRNNQELAIRDDLEDVIEEHVGLEFKDFRLETFTSLFNPDELIAGGLLNGRLVVENPFGATGLLANLKIQDLKALDVSLGNLSLDAEAENLGEYKMKLALKDGAVDLDLGGSFLANEAGGEFDLDLDIHKIEMKLIADLSSGELRNAEGYISGKINAYGNTNDPQYEGELVFNQAVFTVAQLNARYSLSEERIKVDNSGVYLSQFTMQDSEGQKFVVDGTVFTEDYTNPRFDLKLKANNFRAVNSSRDDNDLFFGIAIIDADVTIKGDLALPRVNANFNVKEGTKFNVIIPETQLDVVKRDGTVIFVNRQDPFDILTRQTDEMLNTFTGYDIRSVLKVDPNAEFKVIVDERSGDNLLVSGEANLNLEINPNGRITLSGTYEINKGHYEMSLYNLVSRRFEIAQGSTIAWNGDPMDANMNISAIYNIRTASSELMASQLSGSSADSRIQYQQELPFQVFLNVGGELLKPEISFRLDMPEDQRGALGGNVYSRVMQVNEQEDELNKQVFSLLVLNRFFPSTGSDGSGGGASAIARNSVSQVLSGQLNALSNSLFGSSGLELDFDLDSFTDFQSGSAQDRTQLNVSARKRLFDDRLVVQVGSQVDVEGSSQNPDQANAILGNISLEYMLTENGRYRLRAFRKNQFESIIDGQLIVTGIGLIFNREFNRFLELWRGVDLSAEGTNPIDEIQNGNEKKEDQNQFPKNENPDILKKEENED